jgi:hypothetical protein
MIIIIKTKEDFTDHPKKKKYHAHSSHVKDFAGSIDIL